MIILFGLPGSGKGTQGKELAEIFGWKVLSSGQAVRELGEYDEVINRGHLIPDEDIIRIMEKQIEKDELEGFDVILDGFPRTEVQGRYVLEKFGDDLHGAIIIDVPKEELYKRLALRDRDDDKEKAAIERRFEIFEQNMCSILPLLEANNIPVVKVDGTGTVGEVTDRLVEVVKGLNAEATEQNDDVNGGEIEKSYGE